jgi:hypothetical protein
MPFACHECEQEIRSPTAFFCPYCGAKRSHEERERHIIEQALLVRATGGAPEEPATSDQATGPSPLDEIDHQVSEDMAKEIVPLARSTAILRLLLMFQIFLTALSIPVGIYEYRTYASFAAGASPDVFAIDVLTTILSLVRIIVFIVLGICFLRWIYRAAKNLQALFGERMEFSPGMAVGWYFVPIYNLVKPYQAMREIWRLSHGAESTREVILGLWWFLWIVSVFISNIALWFTRGARDVSGDAASRYAYLASDAVDVILAVVALMLVTHIGAAQARNIVEPGSDRA